MEKIQIKPVFIDDRGNISDIFYDQNINHVALINSSKSAIRGNHYHLKTIQYALITKGSFEYWYKSINSDNLSKCEVISENEMVVSKPGEIHAFRMLEDTQMIVFSEGLRGGSDYEKDTYRVESTIIE